MPKPTKGPSLRPGGKFSGFKKGRVGMKKPKRAKRHYGRSY